MSEPTRSFSLSIRQCLNIASNKNMANMPTMQRGYLLIIPWAGQLTPKSKNHFKKCFHLKMFS